MQGPWRAVLERRIPGGQPVALREAEQADHAVHVEEEERSVGLVSDARSKCVTNVLRLG